MRKLRRHGQAFSRAAALAPVLLLAACGGGGVASPGNYDTAEYRRSTAPVAANVLPVWNTGYTGVGVCDLSAFRRWQPGHVADARGDTGTALRLNVER
jgi:hypothetical protein